MNDRKIIRFIWFALTFCSSSFPAAAEDFTNAVQAFLEHRGEVEQTHGAIVVGILDEHGSSVIGYGKLDNGTDGEVNGDTIFNLNSSTCLFTALLLQDMVERGEMSLDDPVVKYLPKSVKMPTHNSKEITLRHLVTETPGFPFQSEAFEYVDQKRAGSPLTNLTVNDLYAFVSDYRLTRDPGAVHQHGSVDMPLLGQAMALKAGTNYEALLAGLPEWLPCRIAAWIACGLLILVHVPGAIAGRVLAVKATPLIVEVYNRLGDIGDWPGIENQNVIVVNPPYVYALNAAPFYKAYQHQPLPRTLRTLVPGCNGPTTRHW
jgi:hypothetical protein